MLVPHFPLAALVHPHACIAFDEVVFLALVAVAARHASGNERCVRAEHRPIDTVALRLQQIHLFGHEADLILLAPDLRFVVYDLEIVRIDLFQRDGVACNQRLVIGCIGRA